MGWHATDEPEAERVGGGKEADAQSRWGHHDSAAPRLGLRRWLHTGFDGILCNAREELLFILLDDPAHRDIPRDPAVCGYPSFEQFIGSGDLKLFSPIIEETLLCELVQEPECAHDGHVRSLRKLRRVPNPRSGYREERLRETLPQEDL